MNKVLIGLALAGGLFAPIGTHAQDAGAEPKIELSHFMSAYSVADIEAVTKFYVDVLDFEVVKDVPLGEASESWSADIYDGVTFKRTITGTSLPLVYSAAAQTTDFGAPVTTGFEVNLYQVDPTLSLRGYPLALAA